MTSFGARLREARDYFTDLMQHYFIRYRVDIPGVLTGVASFIMLVLALTVIVHSVG